MYGDSLLRAPGRHRCLVPGLIPHQEPSGDAPKREQARDLPGPVAFVFYAAAARVQTRGRLAPTDLTGFFHTLGPSLQPQPTRAAGPPNNLRSTTLNHTTIAILRFPGGQQRAGY